MLPLEPAQAVAEGSFSPVPVLTGYTQDEARAYVSFDYPFGPPPTPAFYQRKLGRAFGERTEAVEHRYPLAACPSPTAALRWAAVVTDRMFVCPQLKDAAAFARHVPTFVHEFANPDGIELIPFSPGLPSGASHSGELPLLFDLTHGAPLDLTTGETTPLSRGQQVLGRTMIDYWTQFARSGNPNRNGLPAWPQPVAATGRQALQLAPGADAARPVNSYDRHRCDFWQSFLGSKGLDSKGQ